MTTRYLTRYKNTTEIMTKCICPKCRRTHKTKLFWTGNGTPRIFCHNCRFHSIVAEFYYEEPHKIHTESEHYY